MKQNQHGKRHNYQSVTVRKHFRLFLRHIGRKEVSDITSFLFSVTNKYSNKIQFTYQELSEVII